MKGDVAVTSVLPEGRGIEVEDIGGGWLRIRSRCNRHVAIAVTAAELRAFIIAAGMGAFDEIAGFELREKAS